MWATKDKVLHQLGSLDGSDSCDSALSVAVSSTLTLPFTGSPDFIPVLESPTLNSHQKPFDYLKNFDTCNCNEVEYPHTLFSVESYFPSLKFLYPFEAEINYSHGCRSAWSRCHYWLGPLAVAAYLALVFAGGKWTTKRNEGTDIEKDEKRNDHASSRKAIGIYKLLGMNDISCNFLHRTGIRIMLQWWNLGLCIFSVIGAIRVVPHLAAVIGSVGFAGSLCAPAIYLYGDGAAGLWVMLFVVSKFIELLDTVFLLLRKRPLRFLHYYHHASVLLYTWDAYCSEQPAGLYFVAMNYSVHAAMYFYYFLTAYCRVPAIWAVAVTTAQIAQMLAGVALTAASFYFASIAPLRRYWTPSDVFTISSLGHRSNFISTTEFPVHGFLIHLKNGQIWSSFSLLTRFLPQPPRFHAINKFNLIAASLIYSTYLYLFAVFFLNRYVLKTTHTQNNAQESKNMKKELYEENSTSIIREQISVSRNQEDTYSENGDITAEN